MAGVAWSCEESTPVSSCSNTEPIRDVLYWTVWICSENSFKIMQWANYAFNLLCPAKSQTFANFSTNCHWIIRWKISSPRYSRINKLDIIRVVVRTNTHLHIQTHIQTQVKTSTADTGAIQNELALPDKELMAYMLPEMKLNCTQCIIARRYCRDVHICFRGRPVWARSDWIVREIKVFIIGESVTVDQSPAAFM